MIPFKWDNTILTSCCLPNKTNCNGQGPAGFGGDLWTVAAAWRLASWSWWFEDLRRSTWCTRCSWCTWIRPGTFCFFFHLWRVKTGQIHKNLLTCSACGMNDVSFCPCQIVKTCSCLKLMGQLWVWKGCSDPILKKPSYAWPALATVHFCTSKAPPRPKRFTDATTGRGFWRKSEMIRQDRSLKIFSQRNRKRVEINRKKLRRGSKYIEINRMGGNNRK